MEEQHVKKAPMYAFKNKTAVEQSKICGCYNCLGTFSVEDIEFWTDDDETALCPICTHDAVIAEVFGVPLDEESLREIKDYWLPSPRKI